MVVVTLNHRLNIFGHLDLSAIGGQSPWAKNPIGVSIGTPALTTRGATEEHMQRVAQIVSTVAENPTDDVALSRLRGEVEAIARELAPI